jgi:hypothetical protein
METMLVESIIAARLDSERRPRKPGLFTGPGKPRHGEECMVIQAVW